MYLLLGATGELGMAVADRLLSLGMNFVGTSSRGSQNATGLQTEAVDLLSDELEARLVALFTTHKFSVAFNCAVVPHDTTQNEDMVYRGIVKSTMVIAKVTTNYEDALIRAV